MSTSILVEMIGHSQTDWDKCIRKACERAVAVQFVIPNICRMRIENDNIVLIGERDSELSSFGLIQKLSEDFPLICALVDADKSDISTNMYSELEIAVTLPMLNTTSLIHNVFCLLGKGSFCFGDGFWIELTPIVTDFCPAEQYGRSGDDWFHALCEAFHDEDADLHINTWYPN